MTKSRQPKDDAARSVRAAAPAGAHARSGRTKGAPRADGPRKKPAKRTAVSRTTAPKPEGEGRNRPGRDDDTARPGTRAQKSAARRDAILAAALDAFSAQGFAATRLEDVARRAGVAKGTIYLHFADKETLFQEIVRSILNPVIGTLEIAMHADMPMREIAAQLVEVFVRDIYGTRRKDVIRLIVTEGGRFPAIAEFYYREVLSRLLAAMRVLLARAAARGELMSDAVARFPQLVGAPVLLSIVWNSLFERFEPLDVRAFLNAHLDVLFGKGRAP